MRGYSDSDNTIKGSAITHHYYQAWRRGQLVKEIADTVAIIVAVVSVIGSFFLMARFF